MLQSLHIRNYALIDRLDIDFPTGFSVITGETGSGKSIMLGALALLLGSRADTKAIRQGAAKCIIEAEFAVEGYGLQPLFEANDIDYADPCVFRREVHATGKSRAFVNDTPVPLGLMKEIGSRLVDIHSQHQNLLLNNAGFQIDVLDTLAGNAEAVGTYRAAYRRLTQAKQALKQLTDHARQAKADEEYLRFQAEQLRDARLRPGEQTELEQEADTLSHAEEIKAALYKAQQTIDADTEAGSLLSALNECNVALRNISRVFPLANELEERLDSVRIELADIVNEVARAADDVEFNPARLQEVDQRLSLLYDLQQKHHAKSVDQLIALLEQMDARLADIDHSDERIADLQSQVRRLQAEVNAQADVLSTARQAAAKVAEEQMTTRLTTLNMPHARFRVDVARASEPGPNGTDIVNFLFSANKNAPLQPVAAVASGGEIARVMLSLKAMIAQAMQLPTIIFDEIDTGVSGETAERMARIMQEMSRGHRQVISITHLPQIAALGSAHYKVYKEDTDDQTNSSIRRLTQDERIEELAHMLSGARLTEAAIDNARTLLEANL